MVRGEMCGRCERVVQGDPDEVFYLLIIAWGVEVRVLYSSALPIVLRNADDIPELR